MTVKVKNETYFEFGAGFGQGFTVVPNTILNDDRISYKALGIYTQILQFQNSKEHKIYMSSLEKLKSDGETSVTTGMKELIDCGYIERSRIRNEKGHMTGMKYIVHVEPIANTTFEPTSENPELDNPVQENHVLKKKISKKENGLKENVVDDVVVIEQQVVDLYKSFKLEKRAMPHTMKFLKAHSSKIDIEVFEEIFINASSEHVKNKYAYIKEIVLTLEANGIKTIEQYNKDQEKRKDSKNKSKSKGSIAPGIKNTTKAPAPKKTVFHNINETFRNYEDDELELLLKESQKDKFNAKSNTVGSNESQPKHDLRVQAIKNVQANNFLTVIEGDDFWEKLIADEIERMSK